MASNRPLLSIIPPYLSPYAPPAAAAALLGHLKQEGLDFDFLDLRLSSVLMQAPTYDPVGLFGENFVIDIPDLPLALAVISDFETGTNDLRQTLDADWMVRYCKARGLSTLQVTEYLAGMSQLVETGFDSFDALGFAGFTTWTSNFVTTLIACAHLKQRDNAPFIVLGGPQVTESRASALLALRSGLADAVVLGEGEGALVNLYRAWQSGDFGDEGVPGTLMRGQGGAIVQGPKRKLMHLSKLAVQDFDRISVPDYAAKSGQPALPFQLSRGCTDKCTFCSEWVFWEHFRLDTVDHAVEKIVTIVEKYGVTTFDFTDSLLNGHMRRLRQFAENVIESGLEIEWGGFMRADMDDETAQLLKRAGVTGVFIGVESLSDDTLELMNKRRSENDNARAIRAFLEAGIRVTAGIIAGFPGDSRERFFRTSEIIEGFSQEFPDLFLTECAPFSLSPAQPIYKTLDEVKLTLVGWPEDVLDIAPAYRDITETISCEVEGPNQGIERLGQFKYLRHQQGLSGDSMVDRGSEKAIDRMVQSALGNTGYMLGKILVNGRMDSALLDKDERAEIRAQWAKLTSSQALARQESFLTLWEKVQQRHLWGPDRPIFADGFATDVKSESHFYIPHTVLARVAAQRKDLILLANANTGQFKRLPDRLSPVLSWLAQAPRRTDDLHSRLCAAGEEPDQAWTFLQDLARNGFVRPFRDAGPGDTGLARQISETATA